MDNYGRQFSDLEGGVKVRHLTSSTANGHPKLEILDLEIDQACNSCGSICQPTTNSDVILYKYNDIPTFLKGNPYVVGGYRVLLPFSGCCKR